MAGDSGSQSLLILLVGTNPLPNYLTALALRAPRVALIHSPGTKDASERLARCLKELETTPLTISDAADAREISDTVKDLVRQHTSQWRVLLNYSGGTKVMASHALRAYYEAGGCARDASYLDDGGPGNTPGLRFDDGQILKLVDCGMPTLKLETLLELHGWEIKRKTNREPAPTSADTLELAARVLADPELADRLYRKLRDSFPEHADPKRSTQEPFDPEEFKITLSIGRFPTEAQLQNLGRKERESWFRQWCKFLGGGWLEDWVASQIENSGLLSTAELPPTSGFDVFRGERRVQAEIDVAILHNYRSYFVSCTTAQDKGTCKQKLFEIAVRARQIAGDLARPALVCLADGNTLGKLRDEVCDGASPPGAFWVPGIAAVHVFGLEDLRAWAGYHGSRPNLTALREWLES